MIQESLKLFSSAYFPPVQYFTNLITSAPPVIEVFDNYIKQTYRNRCKIYSPNGIQVLSVPVEKGSFHKVSFRELKIDYSRSWQRDHLRALKTAYNSSAFYEFYIDEIEEIILSGYDLLIDLNNSILEYLINTMEINIEVEFTTGYHVAGDRDVDLRTSIHPKLESSEFLNNLPEYFQVFSPKSGFIPDLSVLDLLFNMGPESYSYLKSCIKK